MHQRRHQWSPEYHHQHSCQLKRRLQLNCKSKVLVQHRLRFQRKLQLLPPPRFLLKLQLQSLLRNRLCESFL
jgi:hypothetical protein